MKFPLTLSCGHSAASFCDCERTPVYASTESPIDRALTDCQGRWRDILHGYGCQLPSGRNHGPCPLCGGKDRFRFDDKDGRGTWFCNHCGSAGGLKLLSLYIGKSTLDTAKELVNDAPVMPVRRTFTPDVRQKNTEQAKKGAATMLAAAIKRPHPYMDKKGLGGDWLVNGERMAARDGFIEIGELLLVPAYKNGELINMQKIKVDGEKRPITGGDMQGVYHPIEGKTNMIAIVEGYATGVTVNKLTGAMTYCAFQTGNLAAVAKYVRERHQNSKIVFFADHDEHGAGQKYAEEASVPVNGIVALPPEMGDWDDYRQKHGEEPCKQAMRDAIRKDAKQPEPPKPEPPKPPKKGLPLNLDDYDIDSPPGLAGEIVDYIRDGAVRVIGGGAYALSALQCMAMAGAGIRGFKGAKLNLITLTLGVSAGGKEWPQAVIKDLLSANGKTFYGDIRSDKDVIRTAFYEGGRCFYVIDEAQKILGSQTGGNKHMANVMTTMMELATTNLFKLSQLHRDEFIDKLENDKARTEKKLQAKEDALKETNPDLDEGKIKAIEMDINHLKGRVKASDDRIYMAHNGITRPAFNLMAFSTPKKLADIVDEDSIESGFLGRALIADSGFERDENTINFDSPDVVDKKDPRFEYLKAQVGLICQLAEDVTHLEFGGVSFGFEPTPEALDDLRAIARHYDQYEYRNHARVGAIYARLLERVLSLSSIMALGNIVNGKAVIERDYVRYALLLTLQSIGHLVSNLKVNEGSTGNTMEEKLEAVKEWVLKRLKVDSKDSMAGWRYKAAIKGQIKRTKFYQEIQKECAKHEQDAFENALAMIGSVIETSGDGKHLRLR